MRLMTTFAFAAALAVSGVTATAGGLEPEVVAPPVAAPAPAPAPVAAEPAPATSSVRPLYIVIGIVAALLIAAAVAEEE